MARRPPVTIRAVMKPEAVVMRGSRLLRIKIFNLELIVISGSRIRSRVSSVR